MCDFKTYSSFETPGIRGSQFPPLLKGGGPLAVEGFKNTLQTSSTVRNDRKIIPRTLAPPGRAVIPRTLAPPCKAKRNNLILAPPRTSTHFAGISPPHPPLTRSPFYLGGTSSRYQIKDLGAHFPSRGRLKRDTAVTACDRLLLEETPQGGLSCRFAAIHLQLSATLTDEVSAECGLAAEGFNLGIWRKVVPRTLAPPCRAVIPRTLAPPYSEYDTLLFADANFPPAVAFRAGFTTIGGCQSKGSHCSAKPSTLWREGAPKGRMRGLPQGSECVLWRKVIPRTLAPPCSKVYNVNYRYADMEAPYPALTDEVSAFGGAANIVPTSFRAAKPPDSRSELYGFPHRVETGAQRSPACSLPARQYPTQEIAAGYALAMTDFKCIAKRASPQLWNDRTIPPGAYPPRREESPSG